jgi:hypothetical protein
MLKEQITNKIAAIGGVLCRTKKRPLYSRRATSIELSGLTGLKRLTFFSVDV